MEVGSLDINRAKSQTIKSTGPKSGKCVPPSFLGGLRNETILVYDVYQLILIIHESHEAVQYPFDSVNLRLQTAEFKLHKVRSVNEVIPS